MAVRKLAGSPAAAGKRAAADLVAQKKGKPKPPPDLAQYGIPDHRPGFCCWTPPGATGCGNPSGNYKYLGRELCEWHEDIVKNDKYPKQLIVEALNLPPTPEESEAWKGMTFGERERSVKGADCVSCGRNCPDKDPGTRVWCWRCVQYGKFEGSGRATGEWMEVNALRKEGKEDAANELASTLLARPRTTVRRISSPKAEGAPSETEKKLASLAAGEESFVFEGTKGVNVFTQGSEKGSIAVQDHKGVTTYLLADGDHSRIVKGRLDRWLRKAEAKIKKGRTPVEGPKLEVRIKGGEE